MSNNITQVKNFAKWLNVWEDIGKDQLPKDRKDSRWSVNPVQGQYYNNWRGGPERKVEYERRANGMECERNIKEKGRMDDDSQRKKQRRTR